MEEHQDMHNKGDILPYGKTKRKLKTPEQIEALEKFYNEHKYPSESMKLEFAKQIGLSEKQVSGWFCHRRLKDKKFLQGEVSLSGRQSVSTGAMQDHASGLRQESCSSSKQGDRYFDSKEVESKRFTQNYSSAADLASEHKGRHINHTVSDDRSSGSSSSSQERFMEGDTPFAIKTSGYSFQEDNYIPMDTMGVKSRDMIGSGYFNLQTNIECSSVSSVKRKLGGLYHEDGPTLSVIFDPLPPGAFDSPITDSNYGPSYVANSTQDRSYSVARIIKEPMVNDKDSRKMLSNGSYREGIGSERIMLGYHHQYELSSSQLTPKVPLTKHIDHTPRQTFLKPSEDSVSKIFDCRNRNNVKYLKCQVDGASDNNIDHNIHLSSLRGHMKSLAYPAIQYNYSTPMHQREAYGEKLLKSPCQSHDLFNTKKIMQSKRIKKGKIHEERTTVEEFDLERNAYERSYWQENQPPKISATGLSNGKSMKFRCTKPVTGYSRGMTKSSSDDETESSTSSLG